MKKLLYLGLLLLVIVPAFNCKKKIPSSPPDITEFQDVAVYLVDSDKRNLFNPDNPNHYDLRDLALYKVEKGVENVYYRGRELLRQDTLGEYMLIFPSLFIGGDTLTQYNYIRLSKEDTDTLEFVFKFYNPYTKKLKTEKYNNILIYDNFKQIKDTIIK